MTSTQHPAKEAVILIGASPVGELKNVSWSTKNTPIKDYDLTGGEAAVLEYGETEHIVKAKKGWIDNSVAAYILAGTKIAIEVHPEGTGVGKAKITFSDCVVTNCEDSTDKIVVTNFEAEAKSRVDGTQ